MLGNHENPRECYGLSKKKYSYYGFNNTFLKKRLYQQQNKSKTTKDLSRLVRKYTNLKVFRKINQDKPQVMLSFSSSIFFLQDYMDFQFRVECQHSLVTRQRLTSLLTATFFKITKYVTK